MGLSCSHNAWDGSYSSFHKLRKYTSTLCGVSFPPHEDASLEGMFVYFDASPEARFVYFNDNNISEKSGIFLWFTHSDCIGHFTPEECIAVADFLESLLPCIEIEEKTPNKHINYYGGYSQCIKNFANGCRLAASLNENLEFS